MSAFPGLKPGSTDLLLPSAAVATPPDRVMAIAYLFSRRRRRKIFRPGLQTGYCRSPSFEPAKRPAESRVKGCRPLRGLVAWGRAFPGLKPGSTDLLLPSAAVATGPLDGGRLPLQPPQAAKDL